MREGGREGVRKERGCKGEREREKEREREREGDCLQLFFVEL